jgi:hypothetical protein
VSALYMPTLGATTIRLDSGLCLGIISAVRRPSPVPQAGEWVSERTRLLCCQPASTLPLILVTALPSGGRPEG